MERRWLGRQAGAVAVAGGAGALESKTSWCRPFSFQQRLGILKVGLGVKQGLRQPWMRALARRHEIQESRAKEPGQNKRKDETRDPSLFGSPSRVRTLEICWSGPVLAPSLPGQTEFFVCFASITMRRGSVATRGFPTWHFERGVTMDYRARRTEYCTRVWCQSTCADRSILGDGPWPILFISHGWGKKAGESDTSKTGPPSCHPTCNCMLP